MTFIFPELDHPVMTRIYRPRPMRRIQNEECARGGITFEEMIGPGVERRLVQPRHKAMKRCRTELGASYTQIGRAFRRDQSTVNHAVNKGTK